MDKEGVLAAVAVLALAGVLVFAYKSAATVNSTVGKTTATADRAAMTNDMITTEVIAGGSTSLFNNGPAIYVAQTPYLFNIPIGNVLPNVSPSTTINGAVSVDASQYNTYGA